MTAQIAMAQIMWSAAFILVSFIAIVSTKSTHFLEDEDTDIKRVLKSIENLLKYYRLNVRNLNLDGFFGVRVLEGHLLTMLQEHKSGKYQTVPEYVWQTVSRLAKLATVVSEEGVDFVRKDNPNYFDDFSSIVKRPWTFFKLPRRLDPNLRWEIPQYKAKSTTKFSEKLSDKCLKELMDSPPTFCNVSEMCVKVMTNRGLTGYSITHQLLWSIIAEMSAGCRTSIGAALKPHGLEDLDSLQLEMCTNNFYEMVAVVHVVMRGNIHESHQDLFLEQQFVCPSLGFYEFIKKDYLDQILSWQYHSGCFGEKEEDETEDNDLDVESLLESYHGKPVETKQAVEDPRDVQSIHHSNTIRSGVQRSSRKKTNVSDLNSKFNGGGLQNKHHIKSNAKESQNHKSEIPHLDDKSHLIKTDNLQERIRSSSPRLDAGGTLNSVGATRNGRKLLVEKRLTGDCLSHKTGVAAGALTVYLRYLIQPGEIKWNGPHELFEIDRRKMVQPSKETKTDDLDDDTLVDDNNLDYKSEETGTEDEEAYDGNNDDAPGYEEGDEKLLEEVEEKKQNLNQSKTVLHKSHQLTLTPRQMASGAVLVREDHKRKGNSNSFSNVLYGYVEEDKIATSRPNILVVILVSCSPMFMIMFFLYKFHRRYRC